MGGALRGAIELDVSMQIRVSEAPKAEPGEMELVTPTRVYRFRAADGHSRGTWLDKIQGALDGLDAPDSAVASHTSAHNSSTGSGQQHAVSARRVLPAGATYESVLAKINLGDGFYGEENPLGLWEESTSTGRDMDGEELLGYLAALLAADGKTFEDETFPASDASIWTNPARKGDFLQGEKVQWKRPHEMMDKQHRPVVFSGSIDPDDIVQGQLGDCYLLAALAAICDTASLVDDLIVEDFGCGGTEQGLCEYTYHNLCCVARPSCKRRDYQLYAQMA